MRPENNEYLGIQPQEVITIDNYKEILISRGLGLATSYEELLQLVEDSAHKILAVIAHWIIDVNETQETFGLEESLISRYAEEILYQLQNGQAVILLELNDSGEYIPCGFCALPFALIEENPGEIFELSTLIKSPQTKQKEIGTLAVLATLGLPKAQDAKKIVAYANHISLPIFLKMGGRILSAEELSNDFPFLPEHSGDTIVDLTNVKSIDVR